MRAKSAPFWRVFEYTRSTSDRRRRSMRSRCVFQLLSRTGGIFWAGRWARYRLAVASAIVVGARDAKAAVRAPPRPSKISNW